ncbi:MAG: H-type lectin domain-containing protein [Yoonia sp.]
MRADKKSDRNMRKMENNVIGIDQGDVVLFSDFEHDGEMWTGDGSRNTRMTVAFSEKYIDRPVVYVSVSMLDASNETNIRFDVQAEDITNAGFVIVFRTWGDTKVARCRVAWQSMGAVRADDVWDL